MLRVRLGDKRQRQSDVAKRLLKSDDLIEGIRPKVGVAAIDEIDRRPEEVWEAGQAFRAPSALDEEIGHPGHECRIIEHRIIWVGQDVEVTESQNLPAILVL